MNKTLVIASLFAAVALSACGKKEEAPVEAPAPAAAPAAEAPAAPAAPAATDAAATPTYVEAPAAQPVSSEPDYFMRRFSVKSFDPDGRLRSEVAGTEARHHPSDDRVEIDNARIRRIDDQGLVTVATGRRVITNGDNTEFLLEGDAQVIREAGTGQDGVARPRLQFNGERLRIFLDPDRVVSDLPVVLRRGNDRLEAATLDYRDNERVADFTGRVRVQLQPAGRNPSPP